MLLINRIKYLLHAVYEKTGGQQALLKYLWGTLFFLAGFLILLYLTISKFFLDQTGMTQRPLFFVAILVMIIGSQLFLSGFIGELIARNSPERNNYLIEEKTGL